MLLPLLLLHGLLLAVVLLLPVRVQARVPHNCEAVRACRNDLLRGGSATLCSPSSSKNDIKNVLMDLARSTWLSVPTSSRPISSYPSPHRFMSRWNDVMAMVC